MKKLLLAVALVLGLGSIANAMPINMPVPSNAYITMNGFDWAWANPLPGGVDLSYQSQFGWRLPTAQELINFAPSATDFLFAGGNVPFNGTDPVSGATWNFRSFPNYQNAQSAGAVAVPYFSTGFLHGDWGQGLGEPRGPWWGMPGAEGSGEQLVLRPATAVPEPASIAIWSALGVAGLFGARRRRKSA